MDRDLYGAQPHDPRPSALRRLQRVNDTSNFRVVALWLTLDLLCIIMQERGQLVTRRAQRYEANGQRLSCGKTFKDMKTIIGSGILYPAGPWLEIPPGGCRASILSFYVGS